MSKVHSQNRNMYINEKRYMHAPKREITRNEYFTAIVNLYGDNGIVALCFYMASLFRDIIIGSTRSFPLLNIYGKKGTVLWQNFYSEHTLNIMPFFSEHIPYKTRLFHEIIVRNM